MTRNTVAARGRIDARDRLIAADEPLASLQRACGGEIPGAVAIPALLELGRMARRQGRRLRRRIRAQDATHAIAASIEATPDAEGCALAVMRWQSVPLADGGADREGSERAEPAGELDPELVGLFAGLAAPPGTAGEPGRGRSARLGLDEAIGCDLARVVRPPIERIVVDAAAILAVAGPAPDRYAEYAGDIAKAAGHLLALLDGIADADAIETPGFVPAAEPIDLAVVAAQAAAMLAGSARQRRIRVELPPPVAIAPAVGESARVLQVALNLLGNALRYAPEGSTVRLLAASDSRRAALTVADEGPGLSREQQIAAFAKFERLGRSGDSGSGLGLYIARRLARAMGGELTVASAPGQGARFTLELPAAP